MFAHRLHNFFGEIAIQTLHSFVNWIVGHLVKLVTSPGNLGIPRTRLAGLSDQETQLSQIRIILAKSWHLVTMALQAKSRPAAVTQNRI